MSDCGIIMGSDFEDWEAFSKFYFLLIFIGIEWSYNVYYFLLYSTVNQLYIYIHPLFFRFYSHIDNCRVLNRVPCALDDIDIHVLYRL